MPSARVLRRKAQKKVKRKGYGHCPSCGKWSRCRVVGVTAVRTCCGAPLPWTGRPG